MIVLQSENTHFEKICNFRGSQRATKRGKVVETFDNMEMSGKNRQDQHKTNTGKLAETFT